MANFSIKLDLQKIQGAFVTNLQGKSATKTCICIPIEDAGLFLGKQGCYLDLTAIELREPKYDDTHCVKQQLNKERYQKLTDDERKAMPILGGLHALQSRQQDNNCQQVTTTTMAQPEQEKDLPF